MNADKKLFVFDWNGTILADTRASWRAGNDCLEFYGAAPISLAVHRATFIFPILPFYELHGVSAERVLALKDEGNAVFQTAYERYSRNVRTRHGARALLEHLKARDVDCMILSNYRTEKIRDKAQHLGIAEYFKDISAHDCGGTTILQSTTKVLRLREYMAANGYNAENTVIIGDSMEEPEIAKALDLTSIGITGGYISRPRLRQAAPDHIVNRLDEILDLNIFDV